MMLYSLPQRQLLLLNIINLIPVLQCQTYDALLLATEAAITVWGVVQEVPEGKNVSLHHNGNVIKVEFQ